MGPLLFLVLSLYMSVDLFAFKKEPVLSWPGRRLLMSVFVIFSNSYFSFLFVCLGHIIQIWNIQISNMIRGRRYKASRTLINWLLAAKDPEKKNIYDWNQFQKFELINIQNLCSIGFRPFPYLIELNRKKLKN